MNVGDGPSALVFSRQGLPYIERSDDQVAKISRGAYVLRDSENPEVILIATGSEVSLAVAAYDQLLSEGIPVRVVSMPSASEFEKQDGEYQESVLPNGMRKRLAIEAAYPRLLAQVGGSRRRSCWFAFFW